MQSLESLAWQEGIRMPNLEGKVIAIAGGAGGIGGETSRRLARDGAAVVVGDVDLDAAESVVAEIVSAGGRAIACSVDIGDDEAVRALVATAVTTYGGLDGFHA